MKKVICLLLIVTLMLGSTSVVASEEYEVTEETGSAEKCKGCYVQHISEREEVITAEEIEEPLTLNDNAEPMSVELPEDENGFVKVASSEYYGYNVLLSEDEELADAYIKLLQGASRGDTQITVANKYLTNDEIKDVYFACHNDNPQLFYMFSGYSVSRSYLGPICKGTFIEPVYSAGLNLNDHKERFEKSADEIIAASGVRADMSDYDKAIVLHNELALRVTYDNENLAKYEAEMSSAGTDAEKHEALSKYAFMHSAYSAMVDGRAVCDGYSRAYQCLLYKVGILSHITTGTADGGGHAWNLIRLDGKWYHTDLTWGDNDEIILYEFLNMTDSQLVDCNHIVTNSYAMPECNSTDLNYFTVNGGIMTSDNMDINNIVDQLKKNSYARIYVTDEAAGDAVKNWYNNNLNEIISRVGTSWYGAGIIDVGKEKLLILYHNTITPMENVAVEVCSTTDRECKFYAGFYDEDGILTEIDEIPDLSLTANEIATVKPTRVPDEFKTVKYFIWDKENGLKPLYNKVVAEY